MNLAGEVLEFTGFLLEFHRKSCVEMAYFQPLLQVLGKFDQLWQFPIQVCAIGFALLPSGSLPGARSSFWFFWDSAPSFSNCSRGFGCSGGLGGSIRR